MIRIPFYEFERFPNLVIITAKTNFLENKFIPRSFEISTILEFSKAHDSKAERHSFNSFKKEKKRYLSRKWWTRREGMKRNGTERKEREINK